MALVENTAAWKNLTEAGDLINEVCLPLSSGHLLIGIRNGRDITADPEMINRASAQCSLEHFIASQHTWREKQYHEMIGRWSAPLAPNDLVEIARDALADASDPDRAA